MAVIKQTQKLAPYRPAKIREVECSDWASLMEVLESPGGQPGEGRATPGRWIFRGQADAAWELESTLVRTFKKSWKDWTAGWPWNKAMVLKRMEGQLAFDFGSKALLHGLDVSVDKPVALLSAMRHFGVPTRLLDWTYSPYVALYFAIEKQCNLERAAVWAIDVAALHRAATLKVLPVTKLKDGTKLVPPTKYADFSRDDIFSRHVLPDLEDYHRSQLIGEPALENVVPIFPRIHNERISAQQGLFLCPSQVGPSLMEQIEKLMRGSKAEWVVKIVIPRTMRIEILRKLFQMNVHPLSLFAGADGLGRFCGQKAELFGWE
jgi:hypothetical protein